MEPSNYIQVAAIGSGKQPGYAPTFCFWSIVKCRPKEPSDCQI